MSRSKHLFSVLLIMVSMISTSVALDLTPIWTTDNIGIVQDIKIADLDGDNHNEVVVAVEIGYGVTSPILIYDGESQALLHTLWLPSGNANQLAVYDVDLDGQKEIIAGTTSSWEQGAQGYVHVFNAATLDLEWSSENVGSIASMHVADIDSDGEPEVFLGIWRAPIQQNFGRILVISGISHSVEFEYNLAENFYFAERSAFGNLDSDPGQEVVFGAMDQVSSYTYSILEFDGASHTILERMTGPGMFRGCDLGNLDSDTHQEIVVGLIAGTAATDRKEVVVYDLAWEREWSFVLPDAQGYGPFSPSVGDVSGDGVSDIVVAVGSEVWSGNLLILDGATRSAVWPTVINMSAAAIESIEFGDVNSDGIRDLSIGRYTNWGTGFMEIFQCPFRSTLQISFDIKPGSCPNPLNVWVLQEDDVDQDPADVTIVNAAARRTPDKPRPEKSVVPTAIPGTAQFDVSKIDPSSIQLAGIGVARWSIEDVATPVISQQNCDCNTLGADGYADLTLKFYKQDLVRALGEVIVGEYVALKLTGRLFSGEEFEGQDCVLIVGNQPNYAEASSPTGLTNYPNPFNPATEISYSLPLASHVKLVVYNITGQVVATLVDTDQEAGNHSVRWDAGPYSSGIYLYRLTVGEFVETKKMSLIK